MSKRKKIRSRVRSILCWITLIPLGAQLAYLVMLNWIDPPLTITQVQAAFEQHRFARKSVALENISNDARLAVIAAEDQLFPRHCGFDWHSVERAVRSSIAHGRKSRGASTISQQVAKNVFLWQARSWFRKGLEAYFTVLIELALEKRRILELYLNIAEMGPGIFGIEAAANHYFGKTARALGKHEAALIAACLPNPKVYRVDRPSRRARAKVKWILEQMEILRHSTDLQPLLD